MKRFIILVSLLYFISCKVLCGNNDQSAEDKTDCFGRGLQDEENNHCCFMEILHTSNYTNFACFESPKLWADEQIRQYLNGVLPTMDYSLIDYTCPQKEDPNKEYFCGDTKVPKVSGDCFSRTVVDRDNNQCCYYKLSGNSGEFIGCSEVPTAYSKDYIKEKFFKEYLESDFSFDDLICPNDKDKEERKEEEDKEKEEEDNTEPEDSTQEKPISCVSEVEPTSINECFYRNVEKDQAKFHCCYLRLSSKDHPSFSFCSEYEKKYNLKQLEDSIKEEYAVYDFTLEEVHCPDVDGLPEPPSNSTEDDTTEKEPSEGEKYNIFCGNNAVSVDDKTGCFGRELEDAENNQCCFMRILHTSNYTNFACFEYSKTGGDEEIKQYLNGILPTMDYSLIDYTCPQKEDPNKEYFCCDTKVPKGSGECFSRTLVDRDNNQCCYYKLSGSFGEYIGCSEVPTVYSKDYIKEKYFKEYMESGITFSDLICPNDKGEDDTTKPEDSTQDDDSTQEETVSCNADVAPTSINECFYRTTAGDKENFHCCYIRVTSKVLQGFSVCSEYRKAYNVKDIEDSLRTQYSAYGYDLEEVFCPDVEPSSNSTEYEPTETQEGDGVKKTNGFYLKTSFLLFLAFLL